MPAGQSAKSAAAIQDCLTRIDQALKQSKHEHEAIARLKKQSRTRLARWKAPCYEIQRLKDNEAHEREKLALRLENALLRFKRRLPPPRGK